MVLSRLGLLCALGVDWPEAIELGDRWPGALVRGAIDLPETDDYQMFVLPHPMHPLVAPRHTQLHIYELPLIQAAVYVPLIDVGQTGRLTIYSRARKTYWDEAFQGSE